MYLTFDDGPTPKVTEWVLDILEKESIDLLITDLEIGEPTGLELIAKVRSGALSHTAHDIPILVFSGNAYLKTIQQCIIFSHSRI